MKAQLESLLRSKGYITRSGVFYHPDRTPSDSKETRNSKVFAEKWSKVAQAENNTQVEALKISRFHELYGFRDTTELSNIIEEKKIILDAGSGAGLKSSYLASLAPDSTILSMELSDAIFIAAERYSESKNILFIKGDIASTPFDDESVDFVNCDQVLHHTIDPSATLAEFARILKPGGHATLYVYSRKALPRELLDEHFISGRADLSNEEIWDLSQRLTELGKILSESGIELDFPHIPQLNIVGGKQNLQRFIYYNFIKCFWNDKRGWDSSVSTNFDWYAPSIAYRYSEEEFQEMTRAAGFECVRAHTEQACHSGLFVKRSK